MILILQANQRLGLYVNAFSGHFILKSYPEGLERLEENRAIMQTANIVKVVDGKIVYNSDLH